MRVLQLNTFSAHPVTRRRNVQVRAAAPELGDAAAMYAKMTTGASSTKKVEVVTEAASEVVADTVEAVADSVEAVADTVSAVTENVVEAAVDAAATLSTSASGMDFSDPNVLLAAGAAAVVVLGGVIAAAVSGKKGGEEDEAGLNMGTIRLYQPKNAVIVFGATGRTGRVLIKDLLAQGRDVIAAVRDADKGKTVLVGEMGLREGAGKKGRGGLVIRGGVDVTNADTLTEELFAGATQIAISTGAVFGKREDGSMGYIDNMTSERVDDMGNKNIVEAAKKFLPRAPAKDVAMAVSLSAEGDAGKWERIDDVIMGGKSSSAIRDATAEDGFKGAVFAGELIIEGGGFAGSRTGETLDATIGSAFVGYDGVRFRIRSDKGQSLKMVIKTDPIREEDIAKDKEGPRRRFQAWQALVDTRAGEWTEVTIPWKEFVGVSWASNRCDLDLPTLDPSKHIIRKVGFIYSKFLYNNLPNDIYEPGPFRFDIENGISVYRAPRPQIVMVSSAGVERNARIGDNDIERIKDVPIVQLNPGGVLNHKFAGETAIRASGLPYVIVRPTGIINPLPEDAERPPYYLETLQGDFSSGRVTRDEIVKVVSYTFARGEATGKTFELRRNEDQDQLLGVRTADKPQDFSWLLENLVTDRLRSRRGLPPLPAPCAPPPPVSEQRRQEILSMPQVQASLAAGNGNRTRGTDAKPPAAAPAAQAPAAAPAAAPAPAPAPKTAAPAPAAPAGKAPNAEEAAKWIKNWRDAQVKAAAYGKAADANGTTVAADGRPTAAAWIAAWRAQNKTSAAPTHAAPTAAKDKAPNAAEAAAWIAQWRQTVKN